MNEDLRVIRNNQIFLDSFIIFHRHIQCLKEKRLTLNKVTTACHEMQVMDLVEGFEIEANGKKLTDFHLNARRNKRLDWTGEYSFANLPASYITVLGEDESVISPIINDLILTEAGEPHIMKISALSASFVGLILVCCFAACYKCDNYRMFFKTLCMKCIPSQARQKYFKKKFKRKKKNLEANLNMVELTSRLEDRELERMMRIKKESREKPEFQIGEDEKVERGKREKF